MELTNEQLNQLEKALIDAFPTFADLEMMISRQLNKNLNAIVGTGKLDYVIFQLVRRWAKPQGYLKQLIDGAYTERPYNPALICFVEEVLGTVGLTKIEEKLKGRLEKVIVKTNSFLQSTVWLTKLSEIEKRVCRIEIQANAGVSIRDYGTGFLVSPNVIMTNYHVLAMVIEGEAEPSDVVLRFDYKTLADGTTINSGNIYRLVEKDWLIDKSPSINGLDYALLCVEGSPGNELIDGNLRKWIEIPSKPYKFESNTPLLIVQHPLALPLQIAYDTNAIIGINENGTRVTYKTNTMPGSSGSPCFNQNLELIALHHSGTPQCNEGIPISAIRTLIEERGLINILDELCKG